MEDEGKAAAVEADYTSAPLSQRERAMLDYAVKLTRHPDQMAEEDVDRLRAAGLDDAEVLDVCQVTAYYNYVNRLADGLGVELEDYWRRR